MHCWVRASSSDFRGTIPHARSGHSAVNVGKSKIVVFGGLVDKRFLNDITVYDADNELWFQPECTGSGSNGQVGPTPRAFHAAVVIDCHMFIFGGRSGAKRLGDFWVLDTDIWQWSEMTGFGDLPSPRDFAAAAPVGNQKIVMCGGWDGKRWLADVYILDTISLEWTELSISGSVPPARCGHTATMVEKRLLVYGGREEDPISQRLAPPLPNHLPENKDVATSDAPFQSVLKETKREESAIAELRNSFELFASLSESELQILDEQEDKELLDLALKFVGDRSSSESDSCCQAVRTLRHYWRKAEPSFIKLKELGPLLRDYQRLINLRHINCAGSNFFSLGSASLETNAYRFYHLRDASQLRLDDIPKLLAEYRELSAD